MPDSRKAEIHGVVRKFDGFFKVDEVDVSHQTLAGKVSRQQRLVFERGDAVAILLYDPEEGVVVLVNQFRVPTLVARQRDNPKSQDGWITETVAGMIDPGETPEQAVIRETMEETGYRISEPEPLCTFFSSPGGISERIFLYFAEINKRAKVESGGGIDDEDVAVVRMSANELFDQLAAKTIEDPKLAIAAYWLQNRLRPMR
jgi:nudix-type nucleoside diphosphatase (YffH/AdpP family)